MALQKGLVSFALLLAALFQVATAADTYVVLGRTGWTIPSDPNAYGNWAASEDFEVNDTLIFNFPTGQHDVAKVTKAAYDSCTTTNPISIHRTAPANITLDANGNHYFICTFTGHCAAGQKLAISVGTVSGAIPPSSGDNRAPSGSVTPTVNNTAPSGSNRTPPAPSSAPSVVAGSLFVAFLSLAVTLLH